MPRPKTIQSIKELCSGCRDNRYNHKGYCERPGIDAPVTTSKCWSLEIHKPKYSKRRKFWYMPCNSSGYVRWVHCWELTGKKPTWNP